MILWLIPLCLFRLPIHSIPPAKTFSPTDRHSSNLVPGMRTTITRTIFNVVGATIQLPHGWFIDASFAYGESDSTQTLQRSRK